LSKEEVTDRLLAAMASVDAHALKIGQVDPSGWWRLAQAAQEIERRRSISMTPDIRLCPCSVAGRAGKRPVVA